MKLGTLTIRENLTLHSKSATEFKKDPSTREEKRQGFETKTSKNPLKQEIGENINWSTNI